jgi:hypothetical protein
MTCDGICAGAREIAQDFKPSDELLDLTYEPNEAWWISFEHDGGRFQVHLRRPNKELPQI